jgi:hypothetical protein
LYHGLFFETNLVHQFSSGFVALTVGSRGEFSGRVSLDGGTYPFAGRFDLEGQGHVQVRRGKAPALEVDLQLNFAGNQIDGTVTDGTWSAELFADRVLMPASMGNDYLGVYTMAMSGNNAAAGFLGDSYASLWVDYYGTIRMSGKLADGTSIRQTLKVSQNGLWPFYVSLYNGKGSIFGWITFSNQTTPGLSGNLVWFKPANPRNKLFPVGFTNQITAVGSTFFTPDGVNVGTPVHVNSGTLTLTGGNLPPGQSYLINLAEVVADAGPVQVQWNPVFGLVKGSFIHPVTGHRTRLQGVVLQEQGVARGYFMGTNESGTFLLQP